MIRRAARPDSHFTVIRNDVLRDERLSYRARGLLAAILSRPDNWRVTRQQLANEGCEGRDAVGTALNELEAVGYVRRVRLQTKYGTWATEIEVHDTPYSWEPAQTDRQTTVFQEPMTGKPTTEKPTSDNQSLLEETKQRNVKKHCDVPYSADFDRFWDVYPRKVGKGAARTAWAKAVLKVDDPDVIVDAATVQAATVLAGSDRFTPHPTTWLNQERWTDDVADTTISAVEQLRKEFG